MHLGGGNRIATAAKVAAKVAPNVVTGGVVAEAGPRPDFSLWTVEDDLLLENAMEAGAAVEALAKGAMRFSHRFTVRELRERWRALLYDPELSAEASARMVEAEAALTDVPPKAGGSLNRHSNYLEQKRRSNSIRSLYYKRKRPLAEEKPNSATESLPLDEEAGREVEEKDEVGREMLVVAPLRTMPLGNVDPELLEGLLSPKGGATDFDSTFTQMVSRLAAGGVGAVFGVLPGNANLEILEDQKRRQESRCDEYVVEAVIAAPQREDVATDQCRSQISTMLGDNDKLNVSAHVVPTKQEVLHLLPVQIDQKGQVTLAGGTPHVSDDEDVAGSGGCGEAVNYVGNSEWNTKETGDLIVSQPPIQTSTGSPVIKEGPLGGKDFETVHTEVGVSTENKTVQLYCSVFLEADHSVVHTEQFSYEGSVSSEKVAETEDKAQCQDPDPDPDQVQVQVQEPEQAQVQEQEQAQAHTQDEDRDRDLEQDIDHDQDQDLDPDQESDEDCESEQRFPFNESDYDGEYLENEGFEVRAGDEPLDASGSPETLLDHDFSMLDLEPSGYLQAGSGHGILIDPILGPVDCILSTEDTEIPNLYDLLPLPLAETTLNYNSDGGSRDDYLLGFTSPDDEADLPSSPSEFHVYEGWESDTLGDHVHAARSGDDNVWGPEMSAGKQGCDFPQPCAQSLLTGNLSPNTYCSRPVKDEVDSISDFNSENQLIRFPALHLQPSDFGAHVQRPSSDTVGTIQLSQWQAVPSQGYPGFYHGDVDPLTGREYLVRVDPENDVLRSDDEASALEIAEEEPETEADTRFSDVETMIMNMDLDPGVDDEFSALEESKLMYRRQRRLLVRLEQNFSSAMQRRLTKRKALAILYGRHLLYYMTKTEVLMGRMTQDNIVDIDLGKEGRANKVSRQQASLKLKDDGVFYLRNLGRRRLTVNNIAVDIDQRAILGSNCLIEVGGMCFIFEINKRLVKQQIERMHRDS